jgi:hypothetical protein
VPSLRQAVEKAKERHRGKKDEPHIDLTEVLMTFRRHISARVGNLFCDAIMWGNIKGIFGFAKQHGGSIFALSGVVTSACALYLTIKSQNDDHFYKELSIKPSLGFVVKAGELTVSYVNQGVGPAQIKEAIYFVGGKCLHVYKAGVVEHVKDVMYHEIYYPGSVDQQTARRVTDALKSRLITEVFGGEPTPLMYRTRILAPTVVTVGDEAVVFGLEQSAIEPFHNWVKEVGRKKSEPLMDKFGDQASALTLSMRYCSMSGEYCRDELRKGDASEACPLSVK